MSDAKRVLLGAIAGAHGVRGQVKVKSFAEIPEDLAAYGPLETEGGSASFEITALKQIGKSLVATLKGVSDRNAAEALKGTGLYVALAVLPQTEDETWYHGDLIGLAVVRAEGETVGKVVAVQNYGAGDLLEVALDAGGETELVPLTRAAVPEVDIDTGRVVIDWPLTGDSEDDDRA